ncbi:LysE/ArgO family amino acid transporter [Coralloluteibacterium stylophorae]|uniref:LysE family transporter n=1 Tax=Coralloluteibacterium stylophorae TaxID=1776034 RepID=A0A8J7VV20_9GAMM|nr:LysE family transporter [Coralloluteibacterium stylophorae]MBS7458855.1 LysE family transporter [Coralloluteibacterium stylophorae]
MFTASIASPALAAWASGIATGLGLFAVVGAQSAFILRQGLMRAHLKSIIAVCALTDALLITASVLGLQMLTGVVPWLTQGMLWFGVAFLSWYGVQSGLRALRAESGLAAAKTAVPSRRAALLAALGFTLLNPHFWLDMVVIGALADGFAETRMLFAAGVICASVLWLMVLAIGSRLFAPFFTRAVAWRVLDALIAVVMVALAAGLLAKGI